MVLETLVISSIKALDEISEQLGPPLRLRWVQGPHGGRAAVARFRHHGATVELSASGISRLIFHLSASAVETQKGAEHSTRRTPNSGSIVTSSDQHQERIRINGPADTLHLFFSWDLTRTTVGDGERGLSRGLAPALRASAIQALVGLFQPGTDIQLEQAVHLAARALTQRNGVFRPMSGGLSPHARRVVHDLLDRNLRSGVSVPDLARAAGLSLHHFIKMFREAEGCTPHALLVQKRVERATALLAEPHARIDEIAMTTGFSSPSHFTCTFHRVTGVTPGAFREAAAL
jgi:AraC family transcriptional regulator